MPTTNEVATAAGSPAGAASPPVSVVLPALNLAHKIGRTLEALLAHDYPALEIIVVDDGSTDATADVVRRYPGVRLVQHGVNRGVSAARNSGVHAASHELIYLLDADCIVPRGTVATLVQRVLQNPRIGVVSGSYLSDNAKKNLANKVYDVAERFRDYSPGARDYLYTTVSNAMLRKSVFEQVGGFGSRWRCLEDYEFTYRVHLAGYLNQHDPSVKVEHDNHRERLASYYSHVYSIAKYGTVFRLLHRPRLPYSRYLVPSMPLFVALAPVYFLLHSAKIFAENWRVRRIGPLLQVLPWVLWGRAVYTAGSVAGCAAYNRELSSLGANPSAAVAGQNQS